MKIQRIKDRCDLCMLCVRECVSGAWRTVNGEPFMAAPELCNRCGHCVAVCPKSAIFHEALDYDQVTRVDRDLVKPEAYREIALSRRSIRQYRKDSVPREILEEILDVSSHAPTASNGQNVAYTVIKDRKILSGISDQVFGFSKSLYARSRKGLGKSIYTVLKRFYPDGISRYLDPMDHYIAEADKGRDYILHNAPVLVLIHGPKKGSFVNENCNIAATHIMNYAHSLGLGSCYIGFLVLALAHSASLRRKVAVPKDRKVYACLVLGYPAYRHAFTASRKKPRINWMIGHE